MHTIFKMAFCASIMFSFSLSAMEEVKIKENTSCLEESYKGLASICQWVASIFESDQASTFEEFNKLIPDLKKYVLQFSLEGESIATVFRKIAQLRIVSKEFNKLFYDRTVLKNIFLRCSFPEGEYRKSQIACIAEYLARIVSQKDVSDDDKELIACLESRKKLYHYLNKKLNLVYQNSDCMQIKDMDKIARHTLDCLLFAALEMKPCSGSAENRARLAVGLPNLLASCMDRDRLPKDFRPIALQMVSIIEKDVDNSSEIDAGYRQWFDVVFNSLRLIVVKSLESSNSSLTFTKFMQVSQTRYVQDPIKFSTIETLLPCVIEECSVSKDIQKLFQSAQEGRTKDIQLALESTKYEPLIVEIALCLALERCQEETAEFLLGCLPAINLAKFDTQADILEKIGLCSGCFKAAVLNGSVVTAQLLLDRLNDANIHKDCIVGYQTKIGFYLMHVGLCCGAKGFKELFFKMVDLFDMNRAVSEGFKKLCSAWFDCDEDQIRDTSMLQQPNKCEGMIFGQMLLGVVFNNNKQLLKILLDIEELQPAFSGLKSGMLLIARQKSYGELEKMLLEIPE